MGEASSVRSTKVVVGAFALTWSVGLWIFIAFVSADQPHWWYPASFIALAAIPLALLWTRLGSAAYLVATVIAAALVLLGGFTIGWLWLPVAAALLLNAVLPD